VQIVAEHVEAAGPLVEEALYEADIRVRVLRKVEHDGASSSEATSSPSRCNADTSGPSTSSPGGAAGVPARSSACVLEKNDGNASLKSTESV
jgi:hypothetical protein